MHPPGRTIWLSHDNDALEVDRAHFGSINFAKDKYVRRGCCARCGFSMDVDGAPMWLSACWAASRHTE